MPRSIAGKMPAFTSNVEFGLLVASGKVVLGYPEGADKMSYLAALAARYAVPVHTTLEDLLEAAVAR
jgi:trimethylamine:corrinoid methyltransferase-like protein